MDLPINQIICGDCLQILDNFPDDSVHLLIVDPPYNIGKAKWDTIKDYYHWLLIRFKQFERVLRSNGVLWLFHISFPTLARINIMLEKETNFRFKQFITINKGIASIAGRTSKYLRSFPRATEYLLFYTFEDRTGLESLSDKNPMAQYLKNELTRAGVSCIEVAEAGHFYGKVNHGGCVSNWINGVSLPSKKQYEAIRKYLNQQKGRQYLAKEYREVRRDYEFLRREYEELRYPFNLKLGITDVWNINFYEDQLVDHPTAKPIRLMRRIIKTTTMENDIILDPFVGVGATCVAAKELGRKYIGIDIDPQYVSMAKERLNRIPEKLEGFFAVNRS